MVSQICVFIQDHIPLAFRGTHNFVTLLTLCPFYFKYLLLYVFQLLHSAVDSVEKKLSGSNGGTILLKCKDLKVVQLDIPTAEDCLSIAHSIEQLSNVGKENQVMILRQNGTYL